MGCISSCLLPEVHEEYEEFEGYARPNSFSFWNCTCFNCFGDVYRALFRQWQVHAISSSIQGTTSLTTTASHDSSIFETYRSPPRPLPYDADPMCSRLGLVSRREKGSSHSHNGSEPFRRRAVDSGLESPNTGDKWNESYSEGDSKEYRSESSEKLPSAKVTSAMGYVYSSSEDEDVCPTCLEEYSPENPKIVTQCSHHFHLGCIYEWMERSETCPVCCKVMVFDETT